MYLISGLGNPGSKYQTTRHNVGFHCIDYFAAQACINVKKLKNKALIGEGIVCGQKVVLVKPQTFMNLSGESIRELKSWYKIENDKLLVIYDDISLDIGRIRIRSKGSDGGHNGIKSIIYQLASDVFPRIKVGVGRPEPAGIDMMDYVLGHFKKEHYEIMDKTVKTVAEAINFYIEHGTDAAMNKFNGISTVQRTTLSDKSKAEVIRSPEATGNEYGIHSSVPARQESDHK